MVEIWGTALRVQEALWVDLTIKSTPLGEVTTSGVNPGGVNNNVGGVNINAFRGQVGVEIHTPLHDSVFARLARSYRQAVVDGAVREDLYPEIESQGEGGQMVHDDQETDYEALGYREEMNEEVTTTTGGVSTASRGKRSGVRVDGSVIQGRGRGNQHSYRLSTSGMPVMGGVDLNLIVKHAGLDRALEAVASDLSLPATTAAAEAVATSHVLDALLHRLEVLVRVSLTEQRMM